MRWNLTTTSSPIQARLSLDRRRPTDDSIVHLETSDIPKRRVFSDETRVQYCLDIEAALARVRVASTNRLRPQSGQRARRRS
jgi:hypothetical protein